MPLFFITGVAGSGKSTIKDELIKRGYKAYDTDEDGFAKWHNNETGYIHPKSSIKSEDRTKDFLERHSWKVPKKEVEELAKRASSKHIFLCGASDNRTEIKDLFAEVFALKIDDETVKRRLLTRTNNDWGKQPQELQMTMELQHKANEIYQKAGFTIIDASQPIEEVVGQILTRIKKY